MNQTQTHRLRIKIIRNTLLYIDGKKELKEAIQSDLKTLSGTFYTPINKVAKIETKKALYDFIDYNRDAMESINKLYYSL